MSDEVGVLDLVHDLRGLMERYTLDRVSVAKKLPDGHTLTVTAAEGCPLVIERDDGHISFVSTPGGET
jgi:hypothetical protein